MRQHVLRGRPWRALALLMVGLVTLALLPAAPARAASSITVKTSAGDTDIDDGNCSLREALQALYTPYNDDCGNVSSPLTITFDAPGTIKLLKGDVFPNISGGKIVTITGPVIIDGRDSMNVPGNIFDIDDGVLNLANLTLTRGGRAITVNNGGTLNVAGVSFLDNSQDGSGGGAILSWGKVNIAGSLFTANKAPGSNGNGGAIYALGSDQLNIAGTIFSGNTAKNSGGAIYATTGVNLVDVIFNGNIAEADDGDDDGYDEGGGALFMRTDNENEKLTITRSIFNGNLSPRGSGGALHLTSDVPATVRDSAFNGNLAGLPGSEVAGGAIFNIGKLKLLHSTLLNNAVVGDGGAIANDRRGDLEISNSTLIANAASDQGGGIATINSQQGSNIRPKTTALNVTLALNVAVQGGGLYSQAPNSAYPEVTILGNTIITGSDATGGNCAGGAYTSRGHNLDSGSSCGLSPAESGKNANLDAPAFNGGPIDTLLTMKPLPGSAAIDAGDGEICANPPVSGEDQTGAPRNADGDGVGDAACDIGAIEGPAALPGFGSQPVAPGPILFGNGTVNLNPPLSASVSVFNTGTAPLTISAGSITGVNASDFAVTTNFPITIQPDGQPVDIGLTCKPSAVGSRNGGLTLSTNDPAKPSVNFSLQCTGTPTPVAGFGAEPVAPGPVEVGDVRLGETGSTTLVLKEIGTATLNISNATIGGLHPTDFSTDIAGPISISNGGAPVNVKVNCSPSALGVRSATLTVQTNDPTQPSVSFNLSCVGKAPPQLVIEEQGGSRATVGPNNNGPYALSVSPDGKHIYVADSNNGSNNALTNSSVSRFDRDAKGYPASSVNYIDGLGGGGDDLGGAWVPLVSPDGKFVYVTAANDDAVNVFARDTVTGSLTIKESVKFDDAYGLICPIPPGCPRLKGLDLPYWMLISPDGKHIYVSGVASDSITVMQRNPETGSLRNLFGRVSLVQEIIDSTNLNAAYGMALSPDGKHLYATGYSSDTLVVYSRDPSNGRLTPVPDGVYGTSVSPGLDGVFRVTVSPDGNFVYTASYNGNSVTAFRRNPATGTLTLIDTYTNGQGLLVGLDAVTAVAVSPDGKYLFATSYSSNAVSIFLRDQNTGELDQVQVITRGSNGQPPIGGARDVVVSPDGRMIFVTGFTDNQITGFALANPKPSLRSLEPASATAGASNPLTLIVNGEEFAPGAIVTWNGEDLPTSYVSSAELRATVAPARLASAGTAQVGARNPTPGGGAAPTTLKFTISAPNQNPVPSVDRVEPAGAAAGSPALTATVFGAGFLPTSTVLWNGQPRLTQYVSSGALQVVLSPADLAQPGLNAIAVRNPTPGGGNSNGVAFDVAGPGENPAPTITGLAPQSANVGSVTGELLVTIRGDGFAPGVQARWNGANRPTTYVSPTELRVAIGAADLLTPGTAGIDVVNPAPGGGPSNVAAFTIGASGDKPVPAVSGAKLSLGSGGALVITVSGRDFVAGATVRWNGQSFTPSSVNSNQIVFSVPPSALRSATLRVVNPGPGGGNSNEILVPMQRLIIPALRK